MKLSGDPAALLLLGRKGLAEHALKALLLGAEAFEQVDFRLEGSILESGDDVLATQRISGRGRGSGLPVNQRITLIWTVRGGRVTRVRAYRERAEALEAAGLSE